MEHSSKVRGKVKGLHEDYDDKSNVAIEVELPPKRPSAPKGKKGKKGEKDAPMLAEYRPTTRCCIPREQAADFAIGDPVEIETVVRHFGKKAEKES